MKAFFKPFGELAIIQRGASPRPINKYISNQGINWIKIGDTNPDEKYIRNAKEKITIEGSKKSRMVEKGDFLLSNSMSFGRPFILDINGCIHDGWLSISDYKDYFTTDFLYYLLSSSKIQTEMNRKASSGTVKNLNSDIIKKLKLPIIRFSIQNRITTFLNRFSDLIELLKTELALREKQFEYYRGFIFEKTQGESFLLKDLAIIGTGKSDSKDGLEEGKYPFFTRSDKNLFKNEFDFDETAIITSGDGSVGKVFHFFSGKFALHQRAYRIVPNANLIKPKYLYFYFLEFFYPYISKVLYSGTVKSIRKPMMNKFPVKVPDMKIQDEIVGVFERFEQYIENLKKEINLCQKQYEYYRDKLLDFEEEKTE